MNAYRQSLPRNPLQVFPFKFAGGLDLVTPALEVPPGRTRGGLNYEPTRVGYRRVTGYERYDGQPKPSAQSYWILDFDAGTAAISEGDVVTGGNSGATGKALIDAVIESGSYVGTDAAGYLVLALVTGTFEDDEGLEVSAAQKSVANGVPRQRDADTDALDATYYQDAIETARTLIQKVPGSGAVRGVWGYSGDVYAVRNNAGGTAGVMHKASAAGWTAVDLGNFLAFDASTAAFTVGETLTGDNSGASAEILGVRVLEGGEDVGSASGYLCLGAITSGPFQNNEGLTDSATGVAVANGASSANALPAGGKYEFLHHNFYGSTATRRVYGVNGVGPAFEFDGAAFFPIASGMAVDTPEHVTSHANHLLLSFPGGSLQNSSVGVPLLFNAITGAAEFGIGDDIVGMRGDFNQVAVIYARNSTHVLYGTGVDNFELRALSDEVGAHEWSLENMGNLITYDDRGIRSLTTTQNYGDFSAGTLSSLYDPEFEAKRLAGTAVVAAMRSRREDQYILFFDDKTVAVMNLSDRQRPAILPLLLEDQFNCAFSLEDSTGQEILFCGGDDGYVYQWGVGTSFDGTAIAHHIELPFCHSGSISIEKRWRQACLEIDAVDEVTLNVYPDFSYGNTTQPTASAVTVSGQGGRWDLDNFNQFYWDGGAEGLLCASIRGRGSNLSLLIQGSDTYVEPWTLTGARFQFFVQKMARRQG